jgi:2,3-bisphosphoglycerate-independent phosphoglycerate mutase
MAQKTVLVITDGIGHRSECESNAFCNANKPFYDYLFANVPYSFVKTSGLAVGLPKGQMGNSEVGHMCIGSGRVLYQNLVKITKSIDDGTLESNEVFKDFIANSNAIHLVGLFSDGGVHSHIDHLDGLIDILNRSQKKIYLHIITDGRDVDPKSAIGFLENFNPKGAVIATISGRYYTMDRDKRWDRVQKGLDVMIDAEPKTAKSPREYLLDSYTHDVTDEFIKPAAFEGFEGFAKGDGFLFFNFRNDRMRQVVERVGKTTNNIITMTQYDKKFPYPILFPNERPTQTLAEVISQNGYTQLHTAETEKYAHVTFFLNGGVEEPFENESRVLIPSPKVATYDQKPQMSAYEVKDAVIKGIEEGQDFIVVNFANGDMVGHTGVYAAGIKAVETVDSCLQEVYEAAMKAGYAFVLTSDHGNVEQMRSDEGKVLTNHTTFDVYCFISAKGVEQVKDGGLNNIAPTILKLMGIVKPSIMDEALI